MSLPTNLFSTFGFHTRNTIPGDYTRADDRQEAVLAKADAMFFNALQILGYIPGAGLVPCTVRLLYPLTHKDAAMHREPPDVKTAEYVRGTCEGLGLGALYLIPDLLATMYRFYPSTYFGRVAYHVPYNPNTNSGGNFRLAVGNTFESIRDQLPDGAVAASGTHF